MDLRHRRLSSTPRLLSSALALLFPAAGAFGQAPSEPPARVADPIVVTASRVAERAFDVPASVDIIDAATLQLGQPMVNMSESLQRIPGLVSLNRQNYAQDLQISSRGFGARATFGVRGIRLYQDEIPATMPDGQGQTGSMSLLSARRIEVLRGPFSTLYGNASGGVISIFTEDGTPRPEFSINVGAGSYGTWTTGLKFTGSAGPADYVVAGQHFDTEGYRDHSGARRDVANAKLNYAMSPDTRLTFIANAQSQPETQDPLGLTRAQFEANPRGVDPSALIFDTRKTIRQEQGGGRLEHRLNASTSLVFNGYAGQRAVRQYLALTGVGPTSSGGVVDLDRTFGGVGARLVWRGRLGPTPLSINVGADFDRQEEHRRGFVNNNGNPGDLRRDEDDRVTGNAIYAQAEWQPLPAWSIRAGLRNSRVEFRSEDHYINAVNPNDSGERSFSNTSPVAAVLWHATDTLNVYASYGKGFETPTFAELAYRQGGPGLNFALDAAESRAAEAGMKLLLGERHRVQLAVFSVDTDQEIVVDAAAGGRTIYKNAGRTERRGVEAQWDGTLGMGFTTHVAVTFLKATFADSFLSGTPPITVAAGSRLPGVPAKSGYAELAWAPGGASPWNAALEVYASDKIYVNERNSDSTSKYTVANVRVGIDQRLGGVDFRGFVRVNNITDRQYIGSVIVGDTNGRFFEPAPGRNWFAGVSAHFTF